MKPEKIIYVILLGCLVLFSACSGGGSDESYVEPEPVVPPVITLNTPNYLGGSLVRRVKPQGAFEKAYQWLFTYSKEGQMVEAVSWKLTDGQTTINDADAARYELTYATDGIIITSTGKAAPVTLKIADKLLASAKSGNTTYSYSYSHDGRLIAWEVTYQNTGFNAETTKGAAATITWTSDGNIAEIVYTPSMDAPTKRYTYTFTYATAYNMNGLMPECCARALGCEGSEYLYYMGLLGKSTHNLPAHLSVTFSETPETPESYTFVYSPTNGNDILRCQYGELGESVNVEYAYK